MKRDEIGLNWGETPVEHVHRKVYERDGVEYKICTCCGEEVEVRGYYKRGDGGLFSWCMGCERKKQREHYHKKRVKDVDFQIKRIEGMDKPQRFNGAIALYEAGTITKGQLRTVLKKVEF